MQSKTNVLTAEDMALMQREISVSEFFAKNRHLLGFDNPQKALLMAVKEACDNSLDACEEARILPELYIEIKQLGEDRFIVSVEDNGPGIVRDAIPNIFGKLLYGSKFHAMKQTRGQQGIGISSAALYGQLTTGKPIKIISKTRKDKPAHYFEIHIDTNKNRPEIIKDEVVSWKKEHGTRVEIELEGKFYRGKHSIDNYLRQTAISNPHVKITYQPPDTEELVVYKRSVQELPVEPLSIKPHPHGIELGMLISMAKNSSSGYLKRFLQTDFSRVSTKIAEEIARRANIDSKKKLSSITRDDFDALYRAINLTKIMNPATNCLSQIGEEGILKGLKAVIEADFYSAVSRSPAVYRGNPFIIEAGIAYGGKQPLEEPAELLRFANRAPLLYQQSGCAITEAVINTSWRNYNLAQPKDAMPIGPLTILVHMASIWVPFTSESKESIAHYPEIIKEVKLALQECGRKVGLHIRKKIRQADETKKRSYIERYIPQIVIGLKEILNLKEKETNKTTKNLYVILEKTRRRY
ncbi:MAG: DNA topoisomerase VI subunit B [Candidatus Hydrogenedentota bacterium]